MNNPKNNKNNCGKNQKKENLENLLSDEARSESVLITKDEYKNLLEESNRCKEYLSDLKRLQADFENAKKRLEKDRSDYIKYANEEIIADLIGIYDNFIRADDAAVKNKDFELLHKGVMMILKDLKGLMDSNGVKEIQALGEVFDPLKHEAVGYELRNDLPENTVVEELQKGFSINGKIIRHSMVKVSKKNEDKEQFTDNR